MGFKKGMTPWNKKYTDEERKENHRVEALEYYNRKIKPNVLKRQWGRSIKTILLILSRIKKCKICKRIYLPTRYQYLPCYEKSRFCSRKCQHISQAIEFKDGRFDGENNPSFGRKHTKESLDKMSKSLMGKQSLEKHWNWRGGSSFEKYDLNWTRTFKEQIRKRDGYKCQVCGVPEMECTRNLNIHHIDYNKKNMADDNLISLCTSCHFKTNYKREYWIEYFNKTKEKKNEKSLA